MPRSKALGWEVRLFGRALLYEIFSLMYSLESHCALARIKISFVLRNSPCQVRDVSEATAMPTEQVLCAESFQCYPSPRPKGTVIERMASGTKEPKTQVVCQQRPTVGEGRVGSDHGLRLAITKVPNPVTCGRKSQGKFITSIQDTEEAEVEGLVRLGFLINTEYGVYVR